MVSTRQPWNLSYLIFIATFIYIINIFIWMILIFVAVSHMSYLIPSFRKKHVANRQKRIILPPYNTQ